MVSTALGILIVIVVGMLTYRYFRQEKEVSVQKESTEEPPEAEGVPTPPAELPVVYKVVRGDTLWRIAEKFYRSGYNWVDIARENGLKNPNLISVGQSLKIPDVKPRTVTVAKVASIRPGKYTVQKGDWLSKIALRAYGDMFAWEKIYEANKETIGPNPHLIEPGMVLTIPE